MAWFYARPGDGGKLLDTKSVVPRHATHHLWGHSGCADWARSSAMMTWVSIGPGDTHDTVTAVRSHR